MTLNHQLLRVTAGAAIMLSLLSAEKVQAASFQFTKLVDSNTAIPGGIGNFTSFLGASIDDGNVAFRGVGSTYQVGIFTLIDGSLNTVAYKNPNVPDTIKYYGTFTDPSFDDGNIAFIDINSSGQSSALYTNTGGALRAEMLNPDTKLYIIRETFPI